MTHNKKLFLSAATSEFGQYRRLLASDLKRPDLDVAVQEDFGVVGKSTLEKLDEYIRHCDAVIHLIGKATGAVPEKAAVAALLAQCPGMADKLPALAVDLLKPQPGFSYTQWEAYLALYHERHLYVYRPEDFELETLHVPRGPGFNFSRAEAVLQQEHYRRISKLGQDRGQFLNEERLSSGVLRDLVEILPRLAPTIEISPTRLRHTAERLIGRDADLTRLDSAWNDPHKNVVVVRAWGGVGKTSLVATWMAELALKDWRGAECVFDWSFYSQGTRDQGTANADTFFSEALRTFGDPDPSLGSAWDRGERLAKLIAKRRCLLVLDGLEPLQHPPGPMQGHLADSGIATLLKGLAAQNAGLCVVTTREKVEDIKQHYGRTVEDIELSYLTDLAGAALLHYAGATRAGAKSIQPDDRELQAASRKVGGHGLTLQLVGQYLKLAEDGDILKQDTVHLAEADLQYVIDATRPYGHAFKAMEAYENWFTREGQTGQRQLAVLRLLGLFDRPASKGCLDALRLGKVIEGLTESLAGMSPRDWKIALSRLREIDLVSIQEDESVDCHPLLREYFAHQLRTNQPEAWRAAHKRLYEHLCETTKEGDRPTLSALQPLFQAISHACKGGLNSIAYRDTFKPRIARTDDEGNIRYYSASNLGSFGIDLAATEELLSDDSKLTERSLTVLERGTLAIHRGYCLRSNARLLEAEHSFRIASELLRDTYPEDAVTALGLTSHTQLTSGKIGWALSTANECAAISSLSSCTPYARAHAHSRVSEVAIEMNDLPLAITHFEKVFDCMDIAENPRRLGFDLFLGGKSHADKRRAQGIIYRYCNLLLAMNKNGEAHDLADCWNGELNSTDRKLDFQFQRGLCKFILGQSVLRIALLAESRGNISVVRACNQLASRDHLESSVQMLRSSGCYFELPHPLIALAEVYVLLGRQIEACHNFNEAWEIAERGPMRLHMADIHLYRARLFYKEKTYPWESPQADLAAAEKLINECGYHRRDEELADAKAAILKPED